MAGYLVFNSTTPVKLNPVHLGLFDMVREFEQDPFPFNRSQGLTLTGLDELLNLMDQKEGLNENKNMELMRNMRRRLSSCAGEVSRLGLIHVPIQMKLDLGAEGRLYATYNKLNQRIPLWQLFGSNPQIRESGGHPVYEFGESLS
jgi:hypothetical protein